MCPAFGVLSLKKAAEPKLSLRRTIEPSDKEF